MRPQYIELITVIAEQGSLGAAAQHLGKTQPAVTKALRKAEEELGVHIFHRVPHGVIPTVPGEAVIERCLKINREIQRISEDVVQINGNYVGTINIVASPVAATIIVPTVLKKFQRRYPNVHISTRSGHTPSAFQSLRKGELDYVIGPTPDGKISNGLISTELGGSNLLVVTGSNSKFVKETDPTKLKDARWLSVGPSDRPPPYINFFVKHGVTPPEPVITAESIVSIMLLIENSNHLCCLPENLLAELGGARKIVALPLGEQMGRISISLTTAKDRLHTPVGIAFAEMVCQHRHLMA